MLKDHVCATLVLEIYDGNTDTMVELHTDTSAKVLDAVLLQRRPEQVSFHPMVCYNRNFNVAQKNYSATDCEVLAIIEFLCHWQPCLHGRKFIICTNHKPLTYFFAKPNLSPR